MFEPKTLTVPELAKRWDKTPRQIIEFAVDLGIPLYFHFDGLAFEVHDDWLPYGKDVRQQNELDAAQKAIKAHQSWLQRAARHQTGDFEEDATEANIQAARHAVDRLQSRVDELETMLSAREADRMRRHIQVNLRPAPKTLMDIMQTGSAQVPRFAFNPASPIKVIANQWIGHMLLLEPVHEAHSWPPLKEGDLFAATSEVRAIEDHQFSNKPHPPTDKTVKRPMQNLDAETASERRARRYRMCVDAGLEMPTSSYEHLPKGIGKLAEREGVTRQAFSEDVKAHIDALNGR